jgi:hypothetical protein
LRMRSGLAEALEARGIYVETWQDWLMYLVKPIADHFEVEKDALLALWVSHYGISEWRAHGPTKRSLEHCASRVP